MVAVVLVTDLDVDLHDSEGNEMSVIIHTVH